MASDTAHLSSDAPPPAQINNNGDTTITNGDDTSLVKDDTTNDAQDSNAMQESRPATTETITKPIEHANEGIAPMSDYIPKDAPNLSHPTPPPEQPLLTSAADVDVEMGQSSPTEKDVPAPESSETTAVVTAGPIQTSEPALTNGAETKSTDATPAVEHENPLIRPREDDADDVAESEPAAKRSKVGEPEQSNHVESTEPAISSLEQPESKVDVSRLPEMTPLAPAVAEATPDINSDVQQSSLPVDSSKPELKDELKTEPSDTANVIPSTAEATRDPKPVDATSTVEQSVETPASATPAPASASAPVLSASPVASRTYSTSPITNAQKGYLLEKFKNLKKTKHAIPFLRPVDPVALNIPNYPEIVKVPMDLSTMEVKLKESQYLNPQAFVDDFKLIIGNTKRFNGEMHPITQSGYNMDAYFNKFMENLPSSDAAPPPKKAQKVSPAVKPPPPPPPPPARRESRAAVTATSPSETFALQADGMPQIRRDSTINRPTRTIKPPQNRDVTYAKPKRKETQLELKFCEHVLEEISGHKHGAFNHVFQVPVDPVALNIPNYRSIIKHPMDLSSMRNKLKNGQYGKASEFKKDFELMINNCKIFNPPGNLVRDLGIQFERVFEDLWSQKAAWERKHQPPSQRASSASAEESEGEPSEEEEDADENANETLKQLRKQLADMTAHVEALTKAGTNKPKKPKPKKEQTKKSAPATLPKQPVKLSKPKAAKPRQKPVTYDEKQEISQAVEKMDGQQVERLTQIITENCAKYRNMGDDMELEIDDLPNDVQLLLLKHVRTIFGAPHP
ncbi:Bromodomain-containing protein [Polychaeton citri CBS 116435]|uniref:Bromodomain-containing protein n=1 Tax=Polychaeton citri CBS 116435 TaxID=1314669 RepID=A0A9P4UQ48_9PEZI|nr:Bromodomain-containing protein [Polychaeton citri CBS 116435]